MSNQEFISKYGKQEFYALNDSVCTQLELWKINKDIRGFKCSNRKKCAILYLNNGTSKKVEYARIFTDKMILQNI